MYQNVSTVTCNKCGNQFSFIPIVVGDPFRSPTMQEEYGLKNWLRLSSDVHLCPACSSVYRAKLGEYQEELRRVIGVPNVTLSVSASR